MLRSITLHGFLLLLTLAVTAIVPVCIAGAAQRQPAKDVVVAAKIKMPVKDEDAAARSAFEFPSILLAN